MEEAPKPTLQDELEWCISQLEIGLVRLNPTPKQAEETSHILRILRSRKAPLVKKRQVMNRVFGNYRLKMAEERERTVKAAARPEEVQIKPGNPSGGLVYRKQSSGPSVVPTSWFVPSDNSYQFDFVLLERDSEELEDVTESATDVQGLEDSRRQPSGNDLSGRLDFSTGSQGDEFAFNFAIPDVPPLPSFGADLGSEATTEVEVDSLCSAAVMIPEKSAILKSGTPGVAHDSCAIKEDGLRQEVPKLLSATQVDLGESKGTKPTAATGGISSKKKRKKKQLPAKGGPNGSINGGCTSQGKDTSDQTEICQSEEQLKKEVDWCVEQLELGLKTQKSTPKQRDESLRAIKLLRSEKTVLAKKRQLMRVMFGDYRTKIAEERQKQLKLMQAAAKTAHIAAVTEQASRKKGQVFHKSAEKLRGVKIPAGHFHHSSSSSGDPGTADTSSFQFSSSQEEFCFNFF